MEITFNSEKIRYTGRTDIRKDCARFYFAASNAAVRFRGTSASADIRHKTVWGRLSLGYIIDGRMGRIPLNSADDGKEMTFVIAENLEPDTEHSLIIYKMHAANQVLDVISLSTDGEFTEAPERAALRLEFYGDSVCAGEVAEAYDFTGRSDPPSHDSVYDNSYLSFPWQTARLLDAELHNIAQGGISVLDKKGYFHAPDTIGMESVYDKLCYFPEGGEITRWDFSRYVPHIAVFALGQNDRRDSLLNNDSVDIKDPAVRSGWKDGYKRIVKDVHSHYGNGTKYIFITTLLMHDPEWDTAIEEMTEELKSEGIPVFHMLFRRNGSATPGHPRYAEHREMAEELSEYIRGVLK